MNVATSPFMELDSDASDGEDVNDDGELDDDDELDYGVLHDAGEDIAGRGRVLSAWGSEWWYAGSPWHSGRELVHTLLAFV